MGALAREGVRGTKNGLTKDDVRENLKRLGQRRNAGPNANPLFINAFPRSSGKSDIRSLDLLLTYDSFAFVHSPPSFKVTLANYSQLDWIAPRPLLMIAGGEADTKYLSEEAIKKASEPKKLVVVKGETHSSLFQHVQKILSDLLEFYQQSLVESPYSPPATKDSRVDEMMTPIDLTAEG